MGPSIQLSQGPGHLGRLCKGKPLDVFTPWMVVVVAIVCGDEGFQVHWINSRVALICCEDNVTDPVELQKQNW